MNLFDVVYWIGTIIIIITIFCCYYYSKKYKGHDYLNSIKLFSIIGLILSINTFFALYIRSYKNTIAPEIRYLLQNICFITQVICLFQFFNKVLPNKSTLTFRFMRNISTIIIVASLALAVICVIQKIEFYSGVLGALILMPFCFFYFKNLLQELPTKNLLKDSSFLIVLGIMISAPVSFVSVSSIMFLPKNIPFMTTTLGNFMFLISNIGLIVFYLLIIRAYRCTKFPLNF